MEYSKITKLVSDNTVTGVHKQISKSKDMVALEQVAQSFETYFYSLILKNARQAKLAEGLTNENKIFGEMLDKNFSKIVSSQNRSEISESIINQFKKYI